MVSVATLMMSVVVGLPAPLNPIYEERYGLRPGVLTGAFATYVVCAAAGMLTCGQLSDRVGRRPVCVGALAFSLASCLAFLLVRDSVTFVAARALAGIGVGVGMSSLGAYVVDLAPTALRWVAALVTSAAAPAGVALGAIVSGALVQFAPSPTVLGFAVFAVLIALCVVAVWLAPETVTTRAAVGRLIPRISVPPGLRVAFVGGCLCFVACWALGGFYQSLGATIAHDSLGLDGALVGGVVSAAVIGTSLFGGLAASRMSTSRALALGVACFVMGVLLVAVTIRTGEPVLFLLASAGAGLGFGSGFNACMRALLDAARPREIAGVLSAVYLIGFAGSAVPNAVGGLAVEAFGLADVVAAYAVLTGVMVLTAGIIVGWSLRSEAAV